MGKIRKLILMKQMDIDYYEQEIKKFIYEDEEDDLVVYDDTFDGDIYART